MEACLPAPLNQRSSVNEGRENEDQHPGGLPSSSYASTVPSFWGGGDFFTFPSSFAASDSFFLLLSVTEDAQHLKVFLDLAHIQSLTPSLTSSHRFILPRGTWLHPDELDPNLHLDHYWITINTGIMVNGSNQQS